MKGKDIIMVANQPWDDDLGSNCRNIAIELSRDNRILYVNPPLDRKLAWTRSSEPAVVKIKGIIDRKAHAIEEFNQSIWILNPDYLAESINWIPIQLLHDSLNWRNNMMFSDSIKRAIKCLNFADFVIFNDNVIIRAFYLKQMLRPSLYVYYLRDYLVSQPYYKKHGRRLEPKLIGRSDIIVANSTFLRDNALRHNHNSHYVGQGCELDIFDPGVQRPCPEELQALTRPIIGYIGFLTSLRLDMDLIYFLAKSKPQCTIVLVGPEDDDFKKSRLHSLKNVIFTGKKNADSLPNYLQHFDVCINPQIVNDLTIGNYPRKIDEYLAMGKPVVATRTHAMEIFSDFCYLASTKGDYATLVETAMKEDSADKAKGRINFANSHNWKKNVQDMCRIIEENSPRR